MQQEQGRESGMMVYRETVGDVRFFYLLVLGQVGQFPFYGEILMLV